MYSDVASVEIAMGGTAVQQSAECNTGVLKMKIEGIRSGSCGVETEDPGRRLRRNANARGLGERLSAQWAAAGAAAGAAEDAWEARALAA